MSMDGGDPFSSLINYNLVQSAYVSKAGFDLAKDLNISTEDDVLFALFARGINEAQPNEPSRQAALCVYSMKYIEERFLDNIKLCGQGELMRGLAIFKVDRKCLKMNFSPTDDITCGFDTNYPLGGTLPVTQRSALVTTNSRLTAVAATTAHMYTIVFIGTDDGQLKKAVLDSATSAHEYEKIDIDPGREILADMEFDMSGLFVYVMTARLLSKVKVQECLRHQRCNQCLGAEDPYCGWCSQDNKCTINDNCRGNWLAFKGSQCTSITRVEPDEIPTTVAKYVDLTVQNLPAVSGQLSCVFTVRSQKLITGATRKPGGVIISCPTPQTNLLPLVAPGEHILSARLSIQVDTGPDFAATNFTFYDCSTYSNCHQCVSAEFACDWCAESALCTSNTEEYCRNQNVISGMNRIGHSTGRKGPTFCPYITTNQDPALYIPSGSSYSIKVQAMNLLVTTLLTVQLFTDFSAAKSLFSEFQTEFMCEFQFGTGTHRRPARRYNNYIECDRMEFSYYDSLPNVTAKFAVTWASGKVLDNIENIRGASVASFPADRCLSRSVLVIMYKCERMAKSCGLCLHLPHHYGCGWCVPQETCTVSSKCASHGQEWLDVNGVCSNPRITKFYPISGPVEGGTRLTIEGINLGRTFNDIKQAVRTNNVACKPLRELYDVSTRIVCITGPANHHKTQSGPVVVRIKDAMEFVAISDQSFQYVDPVITGFSPNSGPQSGGTLLTIRGRSLDAGYEVTASVGGVPCKVVQKHADRALCLTGASSVSRRSGGIEMSFDNATRTFADSQFTYENDPVITAVVPDRGIISGGITVDVTGAGFGIIQVMRMYVVYDGRESWSVSPCSVLSDGHARCVTPRVSINPNNRHYPRANVPLNLEYGIIMDGVNSSRNMSANPKFKVFNIFPDPEFEVFPHEVGQLSVKHFKNDYLTINGNNIDLAIRERDIEVCGLPEVRISVGGGSRNYSIGYLSYDDPSSSPMPMSNIITVAAAVVVFFFAIVGVLVAYRRKSTKQLRQMKSLKDQIDAIELKVANECKEAFAELQTDMTEWTTETTAAGIPFLPYREYVMQVLFPSSINHPVLKDLEVDANRRTQLERGLTLLNQLFMNKSFLLIFVRTLESNKYFLSKDRVYVGSLLMVILHEKMEYCTDILKTLLTELIEKTVQRRYQPKVLFRRSESVAERMLAAWFTFLMYRYLMVSTVLAELLFRTFTINCASVEWRTGVSGRLVLQDIDVTTKVEPGGWKRLNSLAHYKVINNASLALVPKQSSMYNLSLLSDRSDKSSTFSLKNSPTLSRAFSPLSSHKDLESGFKIYHLVKPNDPQEMGMERGGKMVSEIYLTRLLTTKGTLQKFVEDLFEAIFSIAHRGSTLPLCIKYMFDFMDDQAMRFGITDPEVVHTWKNNSLPLRFWVNLIKNPHFVFDISRPTKIEGCLSVIAQTLMDSCSTQDPQLTKDSPSSKLLFARDIHNYREWVERYYQDIRQLPTVSDQDMNAFLVEQSRQYYGEFNVLPALNELYVYVDQHKDQILAALEEDEFACRNRLPMKFLQMQRVISGDQTTMTTATSVSFAKPYLNPLGLKVITPGGNDVNSTAISSSVFA
uniref:Sema domain-containing protein n=1 Tax=Soboliphyme baturini TaxID=241478 RepID=A0A183IWQ4_9BILA